VIKTGSLLTFRQQCHRLESSSNVKIVIFRQINKKRVIAVKCGNFAVNEIKTARDVGNVATYFHPLSADGSTPPVAEGTSQMPVRVASASSSQSSARPLSPYHLPILFRGFMFPFCLWVCLICSPRVVGDVFIYPRSLKLD
jgi:hypothetical protein